MKRRLLVPILAGALLMSACGSGSEGEASEAGVSAAAVEVSDCGGTGTALSLDEPAERIVAMDSSSLELLLSLGLDESRIVGTGRPRPVDGFPANLQDTAQAVNTLSEDYPTKEVLLDADPDLVVASGASAFTGESAVGSREELEQLGLNVYQLANDCGFPNPAVDLQPAWNDYENLGMLLGVEEAADALVERQRDTVEEVQAALADVDGTVRVFETEAIEDSPYTMGAAGVGQALITMAGGENVFDDIPRAYDAVNMETIVERDPQVIWLMPVAGSAEAEDADVLRNHLLGLPALADVSAIADERFVTIPFEVGGFQSPRNDEALRALAEALHPDAFAS